MTSIVQYLLSISAAAIFCATVIQLMKCSKSGYEISKLIAGIFMTVTILSPLISIDFRDYVNDFRWNISNELELRDASTDWFISKQETIIRSEIEAYVEKMAEGLGATLSAEVLLEEQAPFAPCGIILKGNVSPYIKQTLVRMLEEDFSIQKEDQTWIG